MTKRVIIIHGWGGSSKEPLLQWLKTELEDRGLEVILPGMPDTENPIIENWVKKLEEIIEDPDRDTILVGHSIGCQTILRYLEKLHPAKRIGGVVFIAPWFTLSNLNDEEQKIAKPWLDIPIREKDVVKHARIIAIFSDNDPLVPRENTEFFERRFPKAKIITEHQKGHFTERDGVGSLPSALEAILTMN
jgi:hypothetical protein